MILGLPIDAWVLLFCAVGLGLGLEVAFYRAQKRRITSKHRVLSQDEIGTG